MTTMTAHKRRTTHSAMPRFVDLLRSEWIKLQSLPSTWLSLGGIVAFGLGGALFLALTLESAGVPSEPNIERTLGDTTMSMVIVGQIIAGILGVMCVGAEFSSGTIQSTFLAVPTRLRPLLAKATVLFGVVTATSLVTVFAAWALTTPAYAPHGLEAPLGAHGVLGALAGSAVYLGLCAVFGLGIGAIVRSTTAGAILVFFATLLGPILSSLLPYGLLSRVLRLMLIGNAGDAMSRPTIPGEPFITLWGGHISPGAGALLVTGWALLALVAGAIALLRRDA